MSMPRAKFVLIMLSIVLFLNACSKNEVGNANRSALPANSNHVAVVPSDDADELGKIVRLPLAPEEVTFSEFDLSADDNSRPSVGTNAKRLVAVMIFSAENAAQIVANQIAAAPHDVEAENWFPPELIAKSQETGDSSLKGVSYPATEFLQPPYSSGRLTRINNTNYFVLELLTF